MMHGNNNSGYPQLSRKFVARRISEGETGRLKEELKCQACGKGYKHVSSLAKHLWEHTPEWSVTSKLLISKHQQVQLLEAASILVSMNENEEEDDEAEEDDETETPSNTEHESSHEPLSDPLTADSSVHSSVEPETHPKDITAVDPVKEESVQDFLQEQLTPARDIPITSGKPIFKTPSKNGHHHHGLHSRRLSSTHYSTASSLGSSLGRRRDSFLRQASPLPEALLAKDFAHHPPNRNRSHSALHASNISSLHASRASRDFAIDDEDGLQDPQEEEDAKSKNKDTHGDVFGNLEV